ncbi:hypothetical protein SLA2020_032770 [Shorea laevis]
MKSMAVSYLKRPENHTHTQQQPTAKGRRQPQIWNFLHGGRFSGLNMCFRTRKEEKISKLYRLPQPEMSPVAGGLSSGKRNGEDGAETRGWKERRREKKRKRNQPILLEFPPFSPRTLKSLAIKP